MIRILVPDSLKNTMSEDGLMRLLREKGLDPSKPLERHRPQNRRAVYYWNIPEDPNDIEVVDVEL